MDLSFGAKHRRCSFSSLQSFQSRIPDQMADRNRYHFVQRPQSHCVYNLELSTWYGGRPETAFQNAKSAPRFCLPKEYTARVLVYRPTVVPMATKSGVHQSCQDFNTREKRSIRACDHPQAKRQARRVLVFALSPVIPSVSPGCGDSPRNQKSYSVEHDDERGTVEDP